MQVDFRRRGVKIRAGGARTWEESARALSTETYQKCPSLVLHGSRHCKDVVSPRSVLYAGNTGKVFFLGEHMLIHYDVMDRTPIGRVVVAATTGGLCWVGIGDHGVKGLRAAFPEDRVEKRPREAAPFRFEIQEYFAGTRKAFTIPVDLRAAGTDFQEHILQLCQKIPYGTTLTYGELADRSGSPGAARAVGVAMASNPVPLVIPCHRVVAGDGSLGGFSGGLANKRTLLVHEGSLFL